MCVALNTIFINNNHDDDDDDDDDDLLYWPIWQFTVPENIAFLHPYHDPIFVIFHAVCVKSVTVVRELSTHVTIRKISYYESICHSRDGVHGHSYRTTSGKLLVQSTSVVQQRYLRCNFALI